MIPRTYLFVPGHRPERFAAEAASPGAAQLEGPMIDRPVVLQARRTRQRAGAPQPSVS